MPFKANQAPKLAYQKVDMETSIRQNIKMLLVTLPNQVRFAPDYGVVTNKFHFRLPDKRKGEKKLEDELRDRLKKNLEFLLAKYEPRLIVKEILITVHLPKPDKDNSKLKNGRIALEINVKGIVKSQGDDFDFADYMAIL